MTFIHLLSCCNFCITKIGNKFIIRKFFEKNLEKKYVRKFVYMEQKCYLCIVVKNNAIVHYHYEVRQIYFGVVGSRLLFRAAWSEP